jgi:large subunit ribosomal protein L19
MQATIKQFEATYRKTAIPTVRSGDTVRVSQTIREGAKTRTQMFEGVVTRTGKMNEINAKITVRRIASGVGVEKTFLLHSPNVTKVQVIRRSKVRRNVLNYLRDRRGKSARLTEVAFDRNVVNANAVAPEPTPDEAINAEITELSEEQAADAANDTPAEVESLDTVIKEENAEAAAEDADADSTNIAGESVTEDEAAVEGQEIQAGVDKAEDETTRAQ